MEWDKIALSRGCKAFGTALFRLLGAQTLADELGGAVYGEAHLFV